MKNLLLFVGIWLGYILVNIGIAKLNANTRAARLKVKNYTGINHPVWAFYYCVLVTPVWFPFHEWTLIASIAFLHMAILGPAFNIFAAFPSAWYIPADSKAITDQTMLKLGLKTSEKVNFAALFISATFLVISFFKQHAT